MSQQYFKICGDASGKVLDASRSNVGEVVLWDNNGQDNQLWYWDGPNRDVLRNKQYPNRVLDFHFDDYQRNQWGKVYLHLDFHNGWNQRWQMYREEIICKGSAKQEIPNLRLDVFAGETHNGAKIGVYQRNGGANQSWRLQGMQGNDGTGTQVDTNIAVWFQAVDTDNSGQINSSELQLALVNGNLTSFSEQACSMMIDMFDTNHTGTIDLKEFGLLFGCINQWRNVFEGFDRDRSGKIEEAELGQALTQMGYRMSPTFVRNILSKCDSKNRQMTLDQFIVSCVQIKRLTDSFRVRDSAMSGVATFQYEDFLGTAMGAHK